MDDGEIKKEMKRLTNLSHEEWVQEWGEPEALFLIDLISSQTSQLYVDLDTEKNEVEDLKGNIEELKKKIKEREKRGKALTKELVQKRKTLLQLQGLIEKHDKQTEIDMKLFIESQVTGMYEVGARIEEMTPEFLDAYIEYSKVFEKIGFDMQVLGDLIAEFPPTNELIHAMMERYNVTWNQAVLALLLPEHDDKLYFNSEEYPRQIERLKQLRQLVQEIQDVLN